VCVEYYEEIGISNTVDNFNIPESEIGWNIILRVYVRLYTTLI
jgi:hypothetical protein